MANKVIMVFFKRDSDNTDYAVNIIIKYPTFKYLN